MGVVVFYEQADILSPVVGHSENKSRETKVKIDI